MGEGQHQHGRSRKMEQTTRREERRGTGDESAVRATLVEDFVDPHDSRQRRELLRPEVLEYLIGDVDPMRREVRVEWWSFILFEWWIRSSNRIGTIERFSMCTQTSSLLLAHR